MTLFDELSSLGTTVEVYRLAGHASGGGHHTAVFEEPVELTAIVRPWERDIGEQQDEGYTGRTPGVRVYANPDTDLDRDDHVVYQGEGLRLMNPHFDTRLGAARWDAKTDERELILESELGDDVEIEPPPERDL